MDIKVGDILAINLSQHWYLNSLSRAHYVPKGSLAVVISIEGNIAAWLRLLDYPGTQAWSLSIVNTVFDKTNYELTLLERLVYDVHES